MSTQNNFVSIVITYKSIIGIVFFNFQKKKNIEYKEKTLYVTKKTGKITGYFPEVWRKKNLISNWEFVEVMFETFVSTEKLTVIKDKSNMKIFICIAKD